MSIAAPACVALLLTLAACSSIDCPLSTAVSAKYLFYGSDGGKSAVIKDSLTVTAMGSDTVLYNRGINLSELDLPMSYRNSADTLVFRFGGSDASRCDTLIVGHTNQAHFESIDCSPTMFHKITSLQLLRGDASPEVTRIDSVAVTNSNVNYNAVENFKVYITAP